MRYLALAVLSFILVGCSTVVPVTMKFPEVPAEMLEACPDLDKIPSDTKQLSVTAEVVVKNYSKYHNCRIKNEAWLEWYKENKKIYDTIK
jgi:PBP1b-binding outer membrane lipoprotein LpoB